MGLINCFTSAVLDDTTTELSSRKSINLDYDYSVKVTGIECIADGAVVAIKITGSFSPSLAHNKCSALIYISHSRVMGKVRYSPVTVQSKQSPGSLNLYHMTL